MNYPSNQDPRTMGQIHREAQIDDLPYDASEQAVKDIVEQCQKAGDVGNLGRLAYKLAGIR